MQYSLTGVGKTYADVSLIGGKKQSGTLYINKEVTSYKECELIYQSPAGLYERKVDLLKV